MFLRSLLLIAALFFQVDSHGRFTVPAPRDSQQPTYIQNEPVPVPLNSKFICRDAPPTTPITITAGQTVNLQWIFNALHVGDCFIYLSYSNSSVPDTQKLWFKIATYMDCKNVSGQNVMMTLPSWLPACSGCVMRWEWYALHTRPSVEFYAQCVDVNIVAASSPPVMGLPPTSKMYTIPGHLPTDGNLYRNAFDPSAPMVPTGPAEIQAADIIPITSGPPPVVPPAPTPVIPSNVAVDPNVVCHFVVILAQAHTFLSQGLSNLGPGIARGLGISSNRIIFTAAYVGATTANVEMTILGNFVPGLINATSEITATAAYNRFRDLLKTPNSPVSEASLAAEITSVSTGSVGCASSSSSDKQFTGGDIAATFFGTLLLTLLVVGLVYWFVLKPKSTA